MYRDIIRDLARDLYVHGFNFREIESIIGCSRQTISTWAKAEGWKAEKEGYHINYLNYLKDIIERL